MVFTKRFIIILGLGIFVIGISYLAGQHLTAFIMYNMACFSLVVLDYYTSPSSEVFEIERVGEDKLSIYEKEKIRLKVYNKSDKKVYLEIKDEIPDFYFESNEKVMKGHVAAHEKHDFYYEIIPKKRGAFKFGDVHIRYESNLKLCMKQFKTSIPKEYKVYPNLKDLKKYRLAVYNSKFNQIGEKSMRIPGSGTQFESLRDYVQGDEYRKINWKATARENRPIVNQYEPEKNQHVYVLIDTGRPMSYSVRGYKKLDIAVNTGLLLADIVNQNGDRSGLMIFNTEVNSLIMPGKGSNHRNRLMEALYHVEHTNDTSNYKEAFYYLKRKERRRSLIAIFTDFDTIEEAEEMIKSLSILSKNNIVMLVLMKDERLEGMASISAKKENEIFTKGVALENIRERKKSIHRLKAQGIMCIECPPEKLAINVINKYLHVKNRMLF